MVSLQCFSFVECSFCSYPVVGPHIECTVAMQPWPPGFCCRFEWPLYSLGSIKCTIVAEIALTDFDGLSIILRRNMSAGLA